MALPANRLPWLAKELLRQYLNRSRSTPASAVVRLSGPWAGGHWSRVSLTEGTAPELEWTVDALVVEAAGTVDDLRALVNARVDEILRERNDEAPPPVPPEFAAAVAQACRLAGAPWTEAPR
jgi:hypothetical protein